MQKVNNIEDLWKRGKEFLGVKYSLMGGAMSWISESNLVSAVSNSGAFGVLASGAMTGDLLRKEIQATKSKTNKPFGVNIVIMSPYLYELIDVCIEERITHVILAGGLASADMIHRLKDKNIKALSFAPNLAITKRLLRNNIDALIIEGSEAGGHIGPVSTSVLVQEILPYVTEVPVFVAGGIGRGELLASYLQLGASGIQIGTALVCTEECIAHEKFKNAFINASARDAQPTVQLDNDFHVIPVRAIVNKGTRDFIVFQKEVIDSYRKGELSKQDAQMKIEYYWGGALKRAAIDGDVENGSLMAGQSVGLIDSIKPVAQVVQELVKQAEQYLIQS